MAHLHHLHYRSGFIPEMGTCYLSKMRKMYLLIVCAQEGKNHVRWFCIWHSKGLINSFSHKGKVNLSLENWMRTPSDGTMQLQVLINETIEWWEISEAILLLWASQEFYPPRFFSLDFARWFWELIHCKVHKVQCVLVSQINVFASAGHWIEISSVCEGSFYMNKGKWG